MKKMLFISLATVFMSCASGAQARGLSCAEASQAFESFSRMRQDSYPYSDVQYFIEQSTKNEKLRSDLFLLAKDAYKNPIAATAEEKNALVNLHATGFMIFCIDT